MSYSETAYSKDEKINSTMTVFFFKCYIDSCFLCEKKKKDKCEASYFG